MQTRRHFQQSWTIGQIVKVGFVYGLKVLARIPTPGDDAPDAYALRSGDGRFYRFVPYNGLTRFDTLAAAMEG